MSEMTVTFDSFDCDNAENALQNETVATMREKENSVEMP